MGKPLGFMYALGLAGLPREIDIGGIPYLLGSTVKHDFWAATGFYELPDPTGPITSPLPPRRVVAKFNRQATFLGLPLRWIGRLLRNRERRAYVKLQGIPGIPAYMGDQSDTGFVHAYVDGASLKEGMSLPDDFFDRLRQLLDALNAHGIAYVDTNKPENIILGDDGLPYLIDFQISFDQSAWWPKWLGRKWLAIFYDADIYHALKLKRRFRPDQLRPTERHRVEHLTLLQKFHRVVGKPYFAIRRPMMRWLESSGRAVKKGSD